MANPEHLEILRKGVSEWNVWHRVNPGIVPDLSQADLHDTKLSGANLTAASLHGAKLRGADLREADLVGANLGNADLVRANLGNANLYEANLSGALLGGANLTGAILIEADHNNARVAFTVFADLDLSQAKGLNNMRHFGPSTIGIDTLLESKGKIPEAFLRGCGMPDSLIQYAASLVGKPSDYYKCFISYSSKDEKFAKRLHADLQAKGVRCWFAPEDLKIGDKFRSTIDESIGSYDRLLLVLSEHSVQSDWVEKEGEAAFEKERQQKRTMLFPIRIDDAVMNIPTGWPADIRRTRHIGDFHAWETNAEYQ